MYEADADTEHEAVTRLFDLARSGETDNCEYSQLDSMIYERLQQTYPVQEASESQSRVRTQTAASNYQTAASNYF